MMELDELKNLARAGHFGAVTLDTTIFDAQGLKLESGLLKQLEQFRYSPMKLIISDIVKQEILSHLIEKTQNTKRDIEKSLKQARDCWQIEDHKIEEIKNQIFGKYEVNNFVIERFNQFAKKTSLEIVESQNHLIVSSLIEKYFRSHPPFSETGKKKHEFPDAIALICLENWANQNQTNVIVVTYDNDWKNFCESSEKLFYTDDFAGALGLFQIPPADDICKYLSKKYESGDLENVKKAIFESLEERYYFNNDHSGIYPAAQSSYHHETEITEVEINGFEFEFFELPNIIFRPVNVDDDSLTVESKLSVNVNVYGHVCFSVYDSIDKEDVQIGGYPVTTQADLDVEILITFVGDFNEISAEIEEGAKIEVDYVEIQIKVPARINFGSVEPWEDDDDYFKME